MRIVATSDTHMYHDWLEVPEGDVLIHSGDWSNGGTENEQRMFIKWLAEHDHSEIIVVPGNHDLYAFAHPAETRKMFEDHGIVYLEDQAHEFRGVKFWGGPYTPRFGKWAFMKNRGSDIRYHWDMIPDDTRVLITHGPPHGFLDEVQNMWAGKIINTGCEELLRAIERVKPAVHTFGHIHEGGMLGPNQDGCDQYGNIRLFCASMMDRYYRPSHQPKVIELP